MTQHLFILSPTIVFQARVNQSTFTYPLIQVTFDTVTTGAYTDIKPGMTVLFGNASGSDNRGRQRIRKAPTSTVLYIGRSSQGTPDGQVNLADNNYITVIDDRRVWAKIPDIDDNGEIFKDADIAWTDQTEEIPPKANIFGGAIAATIDSGDIITVSLNGSASYAVADGATLTDYLWDVGDGTIINGEDTSIATVEFPAGFRYVSLTVTDSNGKTHTAEIAVLAEDPDSSLCVDFQCVEHRITADGQVCSFRILESLPIANYPDGTLVIFWEGEPADENDYSNVKFWGWVQTEQNSIAAEPTATLKDVTLNCVDLAGRLDALPGFSQSILGNTTPGSWLEMSTPNMDRFIDYLLRWHSTAFELVFYRPSQTGDDFPFVALESPGDSLWQQAKGRAKALVPDYILSCNRNGELWVLPDPMLQDTGDRTSTSQFTINEDDFTAVNWQRMRPPRDHWIWGDAILASLTTISALFCTAPGKAPGQGLTSVNSGRQLAQSQDDLNSCEGHRIGRNNAVHGLIPITMITDVGIEPANMTWVTLTINSSYTRRALGFTAARCLPVEVNISYDYQRTGMVRTVEVLVEEETSGTAAVTYTQDDPPWEPPYEPPIEPPVDPPDPTDEGDGFGTFFARQANTLARTSDFGASSPVYTALATAGVGKQFYDFIIDPFAFVPSDPSETFLLMGSDGVFRCTDMFGVSPTVSLIYTIADMESETGASSGNISRNYNIKGCIRQRGFFAFGAEEGVSSQRGKTWIFITEDTGDTWEAVLVRDGTATDGTKYEGTLEISPHLSATGQPLIYVGTGSVHVNTGDQRRIYRSTDGGQNWSLRVTGLPMAGTSGGNIVDLHVPYNDNADSDIVYAACSAEGGLGRSADGGTNWTVITPDATEYSVATFKRTPFQTFTQDRTQIYAFADDAAAGDCKKFYLSTNDASSFTHKHTFTSNVRAAGGFPYNGSQFYVIAGAILVTTDGGSTWIDKTGNWSWGFTMPGGDTGGRIGGTVVPVWVAE